MLTLPPEIPVEPCHCAEPNRFCLRSGRPMVGRLYQLCKGAHCKPELSAAFRSRWDQTPKEPCIHFGEPTGRVEQCAACNGKIPVPTFVCAKHGECSVYNLVTGKACCTGCKDYAKRT